LIQVLMAMGHGDDIVLCDVNHPSTTIASQTTHGSGSCPNWWCSIS
jgi:L-fucose mutarotase